MRREMHCLRWVGQIGGWGVDEETGEEVVVGIKEWATDLKQSGTGIFRRLGGDTLARATALVALTSRYP